MADTENIILVMSESCKAFLRGSESEKFNPASLAKSKCCSCRLDMSRKNEILSEYQLESPEKPLDKRVEGRAAISRKSYGEVFTHQSSSTTLPTQQHQGQGNGNEPETEFEDAQLHTIQICRALIKTFNKINGLCHERIENLSYFLKVNNVAEGEGEGEGMPHISELTKGRSIIGSHMWLIARIIKSVRNDVGARPKDLYETRQRLQYIVGHSCIEWLQVTNVVNALIQCHNKTGVILKKYIEIYDTEPKSKSENQNKNTNIHSTRQKHIKQLKKHLRNGGKIQIQKLMEVVAKFKGGNKGAENSKNGDESDPRRGRGDPDRDNVIFDFDCTNNNFYSNMIPAKCTSSSFSNETGNLDFQFGSRSLEKDVDADADDGDGELDQSGSGCKSWIPTSALNLYGQVLIVNHLCENVIAAQAQTVSVLQKVHTFLHMNPNEQSMFQAHEGSNSVTSILMPVDKLMLRLVDSLKTIQKSTQKRTDDAFRKAIVNIGRVLEYELSLMEYHVMKLHQICTEDQQAIHIVYKYIRYFYITALLKYDKVPVELVNIYHFKPVPLTIENVFNLFRLSPYLLILRNIPVKVQTASYMLRTSSTCEIVDTPTRKLSTASKVVKVTLSQRGRRKNRKSATQILSDIKNTYSE